MSEKPHGITADHANHPGDHPYENTPRFSSSPTPTGSLQDQLFRITLYLVRRITAFARLLSTLEQVEMEEVAAFLKGTNYHFQYAHR